MLRKSVPAADDEVLADAAREPGAVVFETARGNLDASVEIAAPGNRARSGGPAEERKHERRDLDLRPTWRQSRAARRCAGRARSRKWWGCWWNRAGPAVAIGDFCEVRTAQRAAHPHAGDRLPRRPRALDAAGGDRRAAAGRPGRGAQRGRAGRGRPGAAGPRHRRLRPADGRRAADRSRRHYSLYGAPRSPLEREHITQPLVTGIRAIDGLLPCGKGQRIGIFGGSGVGKSTLLGRCRATTRRT